jgi:hypothetical protein
MFEWVIVGNPPKLGSKGVFRKNFKFPPYTSLVNKPINR